MNDSTIRRILAVFLVVATILIGVAIAAVRNIDRSASSSDWVNHTHAIISEAEAFFGAVQAGDAALRTYLVTGDPRDQAAIRDAAAQVDEHLEVAKALTRSDPEQSQQFVLLETLARQRAEYNRELMAARSANDNAALHTLLASDAGGGGIREIQRKTEQLKTDAMARLSQQDTANYLQAQRTRWTVWGGVALNVLLLAGAIWLIRDDLNARRALAASLREANLQLEARVQERTAELTAANARLSTENLERQWANQALEHQVRYNQLILDSINDLVLVLTKTQKISRVNAAVIHLTGFPTTELVNQPLSRIVRVTPPAGGTVLHDPLTLALDEGRDLRDLPAVLEDKAGGRTRVRLTLFPLRDGVKVVGGIVTLQPQPV
ncbi:MAG TPA: CHASE3 domain-containing protein [Lacunisphaera sp.]|nr:CHASE3 domain-containing protein [Lacunisphaera sp.]